MDSSVEKNFEEFDDTIQQYGGVDPPRQFNRGRGRDRGGRGGRGGRNGDRGRPIGPTGPAQQGLRFRNRSSTGTGPTDTGSAGTGATGPIGSEGDNEDIGPTGDTGSAEEQGPTGTTGSTGANGDTGSAEEEEEAPLGLRLRRNFNNELRQKIDESAAVPRPNITQMLNILGDTYNLTPTEGGINIKGGPKSLVTFVTNYGVNPDYKIDVPMTIKAFYNVFDSDGSPKESFDVLMRKPAYHFICNHMLYRMVTLKMEIQLQNRSSLRRGELEAMYDRFDEFMKEGKCGFVSKAAAQEAFEREEHNLLLRKSDGTGAIATKGFENKLNYIIAILNKFIEDGMRDRLKQLQANGFDCGMMADALKEFEGTEGMDIDTMIQKYLNLGVSSGGLKVCLGQMKMQAQQTGNIGILIELLGGIKQGKELSDKELDELAKALEGADLEVGRKTEFESLRQQLLRLKTVVEKGKCTSCAEEVPEDALPAVVEKQVAETPQPAKRSPSPVASKLPLGSPQSLKEEHKPGSVGIGSTDISSDADKNPEDFPSAIPVPLFNAFISSMQVEGKGEKPLIAFQRFEDLKKKITELQLENTDIFFIDKAVGFKLLGPPNKDFFKTKFNPKDVTDLGPMPIEGLTQQVKVNVFPIKYNGKYHTFLLVPKTSVKKVASPTEATAVTVTAVATPVPEEKTAAEVEKVEDLKLATVFEDQVLEREATIPSGGSPKSPEIEKIIKSPTPTISSESVEKEIVDYGVYDKDGNAIMITPKSDPMQRGPRQVREPFQLTIRPEFVKPDLEVVEGIGITEPVLIHAKSGKPFMPKILTINGYVIKKGDKFTWISEKDSQYGTKKNPTPTAEQEGPVGSPVSTSVTGDTGGSPVSTGGTGGTGGSPVSTSGTGGTGGTSSTPATSSTPTATSSAATDPGPEIQPESGKGILEIEKDKKYVFDVIIERFKDIVTSDKKESTNQSKKDIEDLIKLLQYFRIEDNDLPKIRKEDPIRIGMFNVVRRKRVLTDNQVKALPADLQPIFRAKFTDLIVSNDKFIESIQKVPMNEADKTTLTPVINKITEQLTTKPFVTEIKGITDNEKGLMSKYYDQLSGVVQIPGFKPSGLSPVTKSALTAAAATAAIGAVFALASKMHKGGTRRRDSNRIRYTRKRQQN